MTTPSVVALIPARSGSKRIANKNIRLLGGVPLLAYTIRAAVDSGLFSRVVVSTDSDAYAYIASRFGAFVLHRPPEFAQDLSPDIEWVEHALAQPDDWLGGRPDAFSILRPTSPFRTSATIRRAWAEFTAYGDRIDSLRAVERTKQHPGKMWVLNGGAVMRPFHAGLLPSVRNQPYHSCPTQALPAVYVQNASLEIAWVESVRRYRNISGVRVHPFLTEGYEGFDLNSPEDWILAEALIERGLATLPEIKTGVTA